MSKRLSREVEAEVRALSAGGVSNRALAKQLGVSHTTIANILAAGASAAPLVPLEGLPPSEVPNESPEEVPDDTLEWARAARRECQLLARKAQEVGNYSAAQRATRDAAQYLTIIARLEREQRAEGDTLRVTRAGIAEAMAGVRGRVEAILSRPLLCAHCSRELSIEWGLGGKQKGEAT